MEELPYIDEQSQRVDAPKTHGEFPGVFGRLYRAAVIGSGGHRLVTRRPLRRVARKTTAAGG